MVPIQFYQFKVFLSSAFNAVEKGNGLTANNFEYLLPNKWNESSHK